MQHARTIRVPGNAQVFKMGIAMYVICDLVEWMETSDIKFKTWWGDCILDAYRNNFLPSNSEFNAQSMRTPKEGWGARKRHVGTCVCILVRAYSSAGIN